jgi:undecaprenyl-diphosphatase
MVYCAFMVIGRLISGVHWLSDIVGGVLFSGGLIMMYNVMYNGVKKDDASI